MLGLYLEWPVVTLCLCLALSVNWCQRCHGVYKLLGAGFVPGLVSVTLLLCLALSDLSTYDVLSASQELYLHACYVRPDASLLGHYVVAISLQE